MVNSTNPVAPFQLPEKTHMDSASATFFGAVFQENTAQFATLETANVIAKMLGGTVVDMSDQWSGGAQTHQYGIQMSPNGPILNAGLIAARCEFSGVEIGLSAALMEGSTDAGKPISFADAWQQIKNAEGLQTGAATQKTQTAAIANAAQPNNADLAATISSPAVAAVASTKAAGPIAPQLSAARGKKPADPKLTDAAKQFEALMIGQMLKSVREASSNGWLGSDESASQMSAVEFGETQLAQAVAASGGLGLAQKVLDSLGHNPATNPSSAS